MNATIRAVVKNDITSETALMELGCGGIVSNDTSSGCAGERGSGVNEYQRIG